MASKLHDTMLKNYRLSVSADPELYSDTWKKDHYEHFEKIITNEPAWVDFQGNGIGSGMGSSMVFTDGSRTVPLEFTDETKVRSIVDGYDDLCRIAGTEFVCQLLESKIGSPPTIVHRERKISSHDLRIIYNAFRISKFLASRQHEELLFVEIGAGYGGLVYKLAKLFPKARFVLIDLPEANAIQTWYLTKAMPEKGIFLKTDYDSEGINAFLKGNNTFAILPTSSIDVIPDVSVDIFVNIRSLSEMKSRIMCHYIKMIHRQIRNGGLFYCANRYYRTNGQDIITLKDFPFDRRWQPIIFESLWGQAQIHEMMLVRTEHMNTYCLYDALMEFPPYDAKSIRADFKKVSLKFATIIKGGPDGTGNAGLIRWLMGLSENPHNLIARVRRVVGRLKRKIKS